MENVSVLFLPTSGIVLSNAIILILLAHGGREFKNQREAGRSGSGAAPFLHLCHPCLATCSTVRAYSGSEQEFLSNLSNIFSGFAGIGSVERSFRIMNQFPT